MGASPVTAWSSEWQSPVAPSLTRTSPGPGSASSISSMDQRVPVSHRTAAFVFTSKLSPRP